MVERFSQINPKVLFIVDKYFYNGKTINVFERIPKILREIPSIKNVVIVNYPGEKYLQNKYKPKKVKVFKWSELIKQESEKLHFNKFDFEQELAILYSSGTTGKPKGCMLSHDACVWENIATLNAALDSRPDLATPDNRSVSYLPLSHIAALGLDVLSHYCVGF